eukprot:UN07528
MRETWDVSYQMLVRIKVELRKRSSVYFFYYVGYEIGDGVVGEELVCNGILDGFIIIIITYY